MLSKLTCSTWLCLFECRVDNDFQPHEDFISLHKVNSIVASELVAVLKDTVLRMNLNIRNCRGQCYDGASNMTGVRNGISAQISAEESLAVFVHCYGHGLN